ADYQIAEPFVTEWQYTVFPPAGFQPKPLPKTNKRMLGPAELSEEYSADADGIVHARFQFRLEKRRLSVAEGAVMRDAVVQLREGQAVVLYFEPRGVALIHDGRVREALASYRQLIGQHPAEAVHHLRLANALLQAGMGEGARAEARAAVKLEPKSALAQNTLAQILQFDLVGRRLRPGSDYAGAEAAYRAAAALDTTDKSIPANLAILMEYDNWGLRYGPGAKLKDSISEYRGLSKQEMADYGLPNNLAFTEFYAGEFAEAKKDAEALNPVPLNLLIASIAGLEGAQAGLAEARKRSAGDEQFKEVVRSAGYMLVNLRKYPVAADLLDAGASGNNASKTAADAATYRMTTPHEKLAMADDPSGAALRLTLLEDDPNLTLAEMRPIASRNGQSAYCQQEVVDALAKQQMDIVRSKARDGEFAVVGVDVSLTRAQPSAQGTDATGYKVTLWPRASYKKSVYVVKEDGAYKVVGDSQMLNGIGLEILDRLAAHDLAGATTLLDWLREDVHLETGDDPLPRSAFPALWTRGRQSDENAMRIAAASLLVPAKSTAARGVELLESLKSKSVTDADITGEGLALIVGYHNLEDYAKAYAVGSELAQKYPESQRLFLLREYDLNSLGRSDEADRLADERLKRLPGDVYAMREKEWLAADRGDYALAHTLARQTVALETAEASDLNSVAWLALFTGKVEISDLDAGLKGAELSHNASYALHTLGCVYAEVGKTREAREVLLQAMDDLNLDAPNDNYWYAFGRIAEQYGEYATAIADYEHIGKPKYRVELGESSYLLAQARLKELRSRKP
ncbi:MAG TPA: tetratricopeptide repeat protein, partial [Candidatus Nitrosotalea sp.]|nr:tetratricopeptide repeat protein [Candidatus Nitrosotalea sp.]